MGSPSDRTGLAAALGRITDGVSRLVSEHLALARVELREDARAFAFAVARIAVFVPLVLVGYGFLCGALAVGLSTWMGIGWALLIVGALNAGVGGVGIALAAKSLQSRQVLNDTRVEVSRSAEVLAAVSRPNGPNGTEKRLEA